MKHVARPGGAWLMATLAIACSGLSLAAQAQGNLLVTPRRVVFEGARKMQELNLANTGKDTATYLISLMNLRMKEDGSFERADTPDSTQPAADKYLRFFPRSVTLGPNEAQIVKVQVIRANELLPGEYRSHLYFRAAPAGRGQDKQHTADSADLSVRLVPVFGLSIPVIIRSGETSASVQLTDVSVELADNKPRLFLTFNRTGNRSVYGDLKVDYVSPQGKAIPAGTVKGIAIYTPNASRRFQLALSNAAGIDYRTGRLRISYEGQKNAAAETLATAEISLSPAMTGKK